MKLQTANNQKGITLVELLIVLVIMAAVSGLVIMSMTPDKSAAERAAFQIYTALAGVRDRAIIEGRSVGLDEDDKGLFLTRYADGEWVARGYLLPDPPAELAVTLLPDEAFFLPEDTQSAPSLFIGGRRIEEEVAPPPPVQFEPTGGASSARILVEDDADRWTVLVGQDGAVSVQHD